MRWGISILSTVLFFSFQVHADQVISMEKDHIPCPGDHCKQVCTYNADAIIEYQGFEVEGKIKMESKFDNQTNPDKINLRTLIKVTVDGIGEAGLWDETSIIDAETLRLDYTWNFLKVGTGGGAKGLKKAEWSQTKFTFPKNYVEMPMATVTAIGGRTAEEIKKQSEKFYGYIINNKFGNDWMSEFEAENPSRKMDRDMENFPENVLSPTFVSLYHLRFIPYVQNLTYNIFVNYSAKNNFDELGLMGTYEVDMEGKQNEKDNTILFQGELAFGDFESQKGKPAKFYVDKSTNQFQSFELNMQNVKQGIKATAWTTSVNCSRL
jgi:hypothetical protein